MTNYRVLGKGIGGVTLEVLCLADESFQERFPNYSHLVHEAMNFCNEQLFKVGVVLRPSVQPWNTTELMPTFDEYLPALSRKGTGYNRIAGFSALPLLVGGIDTESKKRPISLSRGKTICIAQQPYKSESAYLDAAAKTTLHELGHTFGLSDDRGITIMNPSFGRIFPRFSKDQRKKIQEAWINDLLVNGNGSPLYTEDPVVVATLEELDRRNGNGKYAKPETTGVKR